MSSPSVTARLFPPLVKDGVDPLMTEAILVPYDIPNQSVGTVIHDTGLRVGYLRSVSHALNVFANESFIDEMAAAAGKDPVRVPPVAARQAAALRQRAQARGREGGLGQAAAEGPRARHRR